jgi:hypothetical protein
MYSTEFSYGNLFWGLFCYRLPHPRLLLKSNSVSGFPIWGWIGGWFVLVCSIWCFQGLFYFTLSHMKLFLTYYDSDCPIWGCTEGYFCFRLSHMKLFLRCYDSDCPIWDRSVHSHRCENLKSNLFIIHFLFDVFTSWIWMKFDTEKSLNFEV